MSKMRNFEQQNKIIFEIRAQLNIKIINKI